MTANHTQLKRALGFWPLATLMFCTISGGPFGLEALVQESGPKLAILLILVTPLVWALPAAMMSAELSAAIPAEGGYYVWVKRALGPFWGFTCAWWTWVYSWVDIAGYPVLFTEYLIATLKLTGQSPDWLEHSSIARFGIAAGVIAVFSTINYRGIRLAGQASKWLTALIFLPFIVIVIVSIPTILRSGIAGLSGPIVDPGQSPIGLLGAGIYLAMWNYLGWDSLTTVAEEVKEPQRNFPRAFWVTVPAITLIYLLPVLAGLAFAPNREVWSDGSWPTIAQAVGGHWLSLFMSAVSLAGACALFLGTSLAASRIPFVLAEDGYLPNGVTRLHPKYGSPWAAILVCAAIYLLLANNAFQELLTMNVLVYSSALMLEFVALIVLRAKEPNLPRPYRIPGGYAALAIITLLPLAVLVFAVIAGFREAAEDGGTRRMLWLTGIALVSAPVWYLARRKLIRKPSD